MKYCSGFHSIPYGKIKVEFMCSFQASQSRSTFCSFYSLPRCLIDAMCGLHLDESWWKPTKIFLTDPPACSPNAILGHVCDGRCMLALIVYVNLIVGSAQNILLDKLFMQFTQQIWGTRGNVQAKFFWRGRTLSLLDTQLLSNHYSSKG